MASRESVVHVNDPVSDATAQQHGHDLENKGICLLSAPSAPTGPSAHMAPSVAPVAAAVPVAAAPVAAAPIAAAASVAAAVPVTDERGVFKVPPRTLVLQASSPEVLYINGMRYFRLHQLAKAESITARRFLHYAARCNHLEAALGYADLLRATHLDKAKKWYQRVLHLAKGRSDEATLFGRAHYGLGVVADHHESHAEATEHYNQGALLGNARCQYNIGYRISWEGNVSRDVRAAYCWYRMAVAGGYHRAIESLGVPCFSPGPLPSLRRSSSLVLGDLCYYDLQDDKSAIECFESTNTQHARRLLDGHLL